MPSSFVLVSATAAGTPGFSGSVFDAAFTSDPNKVIFASDARNLPIGSFDGFNIYMKNLTTGALTLLSTTAGGAPGNGESTPEFQFTNGYGYRFSPDDNKLYFYSDATNLVAGDTNGTKDLFVKDLTTGAITMLLAGVDNYNGNSNYPLFLSPDNTKLFFETWSAGVAGDTNNVGDIFVKNLSTGVVTRVSTDSAGAQANGPSFGDFLTSDGNRLIFESGATNLVAGDSNNAQDVFVKNLTTGAVTRISTSSAGVQADGSYTYAAALSSDNNLVFMGSDAGNLVTGDTNGSPDIFVKNLTTGAMTLVSSSSTGVAGNGQSEFYQASLDGTKVLFFSEASNLIASDTNGVPDMFLKDLTTGAVTRVLVGSNSDNFHVDASFLGNTGKIILQVGDDSGANAGNNYLAERRVYIYDIASQTITLIDFSLTDADTVEQGEQYVFNLSGDSTKILMHSNGQVFAQSVTTAGLVTVTGDGTANTLAGTVAEEIIYGLAGNDTLGGSSGHDYLVGGQGNDTYIVVDASVGVFEQTGQGTDLVQSSVSFDLRAGGAVENLTLTGSANINGFGNDLANTINGNSGDNFLDGANGVDTLNGGDGNDFIDDYDGETADHDIINGGNGNDLIDCDAYEVIDGGIGTDGLSLDFDSYFQHTAQAISLNLTAANAGGSLALVTGGSITGIEYMRTWATAGNDTVTDAAWDGQVAGQQGNDALNGADGNDVIMGGDGIDTIDGGNGADWLFGGKGADTINGGAGDDHIGDITGYLAQFSATAAITDAAYLGEFQLQAYQDYGDTATDALNGGDGNDVIYGNAAVNIMNGGIGADSLNGKLGAANLATYATSSGGVTVFLGGPQLNTGEAVGDTYSNITGLIGSAYADILGGTEGANSIFGGVGNDQIYGAGGDDQLFGGAGGDRLDGQDGIDTANYSFATTGLTVFLGGPQLNTGEAAGDTYFSIENVTGSAFADVLGGLAGGRVDGGDGNDFLFGSSGIDTLIGGNGNDVLEGGAGADVLNGGADIDVASYRNATAGVVVDATNAAAGTGNATGDTFINVENLWGSDFDDTIYGDDTAGQVYGFAGNDILAGRGGNDVFYGGTGSDYMQGGAGADDFFYLSWNNHYNQYGTLEAYEGGDTITDFTHGTDHIVVSRYWFGFGNIAGPAAALTSTYADFVLAGAATSSKPTFFWNAVTGVLEFDPDGNGAGAKVVIATLSGGATLTLSDIWTA